MAQIASVHIPQSDELFADSLGLYPKFVSIYIQNVSHNLSSLLLCAGVVLIVSMGAGGHRRELQAYNHELRIVSESTNDIRLPSSRTTSSLNMLHIMEWPLGISNRHWDSQNVQKHIMNGHWEFQIPTGNLKMLRNTK